MLSISSSRTSLLLACKCILLIGYLACSVPGVPARLREIGLQPGLAVFAALWLAGAGAVVWVSFSGRRWLRVAWSAVWLPASAFAAVFWWITEKDFGIDDLDTLAGLTAFADNLLDDDVQLPQILNGALLMMLGAVAIHMPPFVRQRWPARVRPWSTAWFTPFVPLVPIAMIMILMYLRGGQGANALPPQASVPAFGAMLLGERVLAGPPPVRKPVASTPRAVPRRPHLVVVMDESVRGDLLDINAPHTSNAAATGLLNYAEQTANFGTASSMANCSDTGNYSFRYVATRDDYLRDVKEHPSIFEFARKAGYETHYVDGQRHGGRLQNYMDERERASIDGFFQLGTELPLPQRDVELARHVKQLLRGAQRPLFVYVNKMGAHFPYEGKYPREAARFTPTLQQTYTGNDADPKLPFPKDDSRQMRLRFNNSYLNAVSWNTSRFFEAMLSGVPLERVVVAYTADHGQDLHEDGRGGYGTHCTSGRAAAGEGRVPLAVIGGDGPFRSYLQAAAAKNFNRATQFDLARSLLLWMGYAQADLNDELGPQPDLLQALRHEDQQFLSTFFVRFGKKPVWNAVDAARLPGPPR